MTTKGMIFKPKVKCVCQKCGKEFYRYPSQAIPGRTKFCSWHCKQSVTMTNMNKTIFVGEGHYRFKLFGHKRHSHGYNYIRISGKYVPESRVIAEKALGRPLKRNEEVHHINGNKIDNRNCNLVICTTGYHTWLHNRMSQLYQQEHFANL